MKPLKSLISKKTIKKYASVPRYRYLIWPASILTVKDIKDKSYVTKDDYYETLYSKIFIFSEKTFNIFKNDDWSGKGSINIWEITTGLTNEEIIKLIYDNPEGVMRSRKDIFKEL